MSSECQSSDAAPDDYPPPAVKRIGHKGADLIRPGNTLESFEAAVEAGVEMIELDVLRPRAEFRDGADWRRAVAGPAAADAPPLLVAHDWRDAARREPMRLEYSHRHARLNRQCLVVLQIFQRVDYRVIAFPVTGSLPDAAVDNQIFGTLGVL